MKDSDIVQLYQGAKERLDRLGYEVDAGAGFAVYKKGNRPRYFRDIVHFEHAESLHAFAAGVNEKTKTIRKAKKKKVKKKKGKKR